MQGLDEKAYVPAWIADPQPNTETSTDFATHYARAQANSAFITNPPILLGMHRDHWMRLTRATQLKVLEELGIVKAAE